MNGFVPLPVDAMPVSYVSRVAIAQRIAGLLRERDANHQAIRAASARFKSPAMQAPTVTYRGAIRSARCRR